MDQAHLLSKWRHLIEPVVKDSVTPVSWETVCAMSLLIYEGVNSVVVTRDFWMGSSWTRSIWVAAGDLSEVLCLVEKVCMDAKQEGFKTVSFVGRRGWLKAAAFKEVATVGIREL